ncbi:MAG: HAD family hydrolase [Planctomycetes bacterium]|nr:HAD family hydrolase [Planctomycetota bacterium]
MLAVLFDMDGVLVDSFEVWVRVMNRTADALGHPTIARESIAESWGQGIQADLDHYYRGSTLAEVERCFETVFPDHLEHLVMNPGASDTVRALRAEGVATAVITNTPRPLARSMLATVGIEADHIVGGTDVPEAKPAPDMVHRALELCHVDRSRAWVVGDSEFDRAAARDAGVRFIGYGGIDGDHRIDHLGDVLALVRPGVDLASRRLAEPRRDD